MTNTFYIVYDEMGIALAITDNKKEASNILNNHILGTNNFDCWIDEQTFDDDGAIILSDRI